jgi:hypothetical protein
MWVCLEVVMKQKIPQTRGGGGREKLGCS